MNYQEKKKIAIELRKKGLSYSEILKEISVAKSTLSLWLRSVNLSQKQEQRITEKKIIAQKRGAEVRRNIRIQQTKEIFDYTKKDIKKILSNPLWLSGIMLYWAEGSKQKSTNVAQRVSFGNSDERMIKLFLRWLKTIVRVNDDDIVFELYIHKGADLEKVSDWWASILSCEKKKIRIYFKRHKSITTRKNIGNKYHGLLRITVKTSTVLNRKIDGWVNAFCEYWGIV